MKRVTPIRQSTIYRSEEHVDERDAGVAGFCDWQRRKGRFDHHIGAVAMLDSQDRKGGVVLHRGLNEGRVTPDCERELTAILPDIARAFRLGFQHQAMLANSFWDGLAARNDSEAMLLIDERGAVMHATDAAAAIVASGDGLGVTLNHLRSATPFEDLSLLAAIDRATSVACPKSSATRIYRRSGKRPYVVIAYPLVRRRRMLALLEAAALVRIVNAATKYSGPQALLCAAFGFTPRDALWHCFLPTTRWKLRQRLWRSRCLPRVHMARLLAKTGTSRRAECIALLARIF